MPIIITEEFGRSLRSETDERKQLQVQALFCVACEIFLDTADLGLGDFDPQNDDSVARASRWPWSAQLTVFVRRVAALTAALRRWCSRALRQEKCFSSTGGCVPAIR